MWPEPFAQFLGIFLLAASIARGEEVTFRNGEENEISGMIYSGAADTLLASGGGADHNYGGTGSLLCGRTSQIRRSLVRFDLAEFAEKPGRKIRSAKLLLTRIASTPDSLGTFSVYEVAEANAKWKEGRGLGDQAKTEMGDCSWNLLEITALPNKEAVSMGESWAGTMGLGKAGTDYYEPAIAANLSSDVPVGSPIEITLPIELIESWVKNPENNGGLFLRADNELAEGGLIGFASSNHKNSAFRPALVLEYVP